MHRAAFRRYATASLEAILGSAILRDPAGRAFDVRGFRLRDDPSQAVVVPVHPRAVAADPVSESVRALVDLTLPETGAGAVTACGWSVPWTTETGGWDEQDEPSRDFVFAYPVAPVSAPLDVGGYIVGVLQALLDVVDLVSDDGPVMARTVMVSGREHAIEVPYAIPLGDRADGKRGTGRRQPLHSVAATEPAIVALARHWGLLAGALNIEGARVAPLANHDVLALAHDVVPPADSASERVEGFRLRRAADWTVPTSDHGSEVYEYLGRVCNVACDFCYLFGNPDALAVARGAKVISRRELDTRLRYFDPDFASGLFHSQWEINEFLLDTQLPHVLRTLRERTTKPFFFVTNGNPLRPSVVELLRDVRPVEIIVSTNTFDEGSREELMHERSAQTATSYGSLELLAEAEIPFGVSVVVFPELPLEELEMTVRRVADSAASFIRVNLPGFTRDHPYKPAASLDEVWAKAVCWARDLRRELSVPLITIPSAFEEGFHDDPSAPRVLGAVPGSPAYGVLVPDDVVLKVGGFEVKTRAELQAALLLATGSVTLEFSRGGGVHKATLHAVEGDFRYPGPVVGKYLFPWGVVAAPSLSRRDLVTIRGALEGRRRALLLTSPLMRGPASALIAKYAADLLDRVELVSVQNTTLGGNIQVLDMATVSDMAAAIEPRLAGADVVIVPGTPFNAGGRDIVGRHWGDLQRRFGVPVSLLTSTCQFTF